MSLEYDSLSERANAEIDSLEQVIDEVERTLYTERERFAKREKELMDIYLTANSAQVIELKDEVERLRGVLSRVKCCDWHGHEDCWNEEARKAISETPKPGPQDCDRGHTEGMEGENEADTITLTRKEAEEIQESIWLSPVAWEWKKNAAYALLDSKLGKEGAR